MATTAFTALVDALFVSLIGLQPGAGLQYGAVVFGVLGLSTAGGLVIRLYHPPRCAGRYAASGNPQRAFRAPGTYDGLHVP